MATSIGIISDTHGLLRPEAIAALSGSDLILHAGDIGGPEILQALEDIAPVTVVRGNVDIAPWAQQIPLTQNIQVESVSIYMLHIREALDLDPRAAGIQAVVTGHSHRPESEVREGVLWLNPGSAGPRRFRLPVTVARLRVDGDRLAPELIRLEI